jgi:hypothetical protein
MSRGLGKGFREKYAGEVFACPEVWEKTSREKNEPRKGLIGKRLTHGYSVWLNVQKFGKQPRINSLVFKALLS